MTSRKHTNLFWGALVVILVIAGTLRFLSYQFSLPYVDHPDEPAYFVGGQEWRGITQPSGYYSGIPPAYVALHTIIQPVLESAGAQGLAATTLFLRTVAIVVNLLTLLVIALTARCMAGNTAGIVAAAAWGFAPLVLTNGVYALPDPFIYLFTALAYGLAVEAWLNPARRWWSVWSVVFGLLAVLMKYPSVPALLPGVLVALALLMRDRKQWRMLAVQFGLIALTAVWLVFIYGVDFNNLQREGAVVQSQGARNLLDFSRVLGNVAQTLAPIGFVAVIICGLLAPAAYWYAKNRKLPLMSGFPILVGLLTVLAIPWLTSTYNAVTPSTVRYVLPATAVVCALLGIAVGQIIQVLESYQSRWRGLRYSGVFAIGLLAVVIWLPQLVEGWAIVQTRRLPDTRVELRQWFDTNLDAGTVIVDEANHKTFNPIWGGIPHRRWVDWWVSDNIMEHPLKEWRETRQMSYAELGYGTLEAMEQTPEGQAYLGGMLRLRDFYGTAVRGPQMAFYRLWRMEHETNVPFGEAIHLLGYDQSTTTIKAGESVTLRFYWKASQPPTDNYSLFIHLTPEAEYTVLAQADGSPAVLERPTLSWDDASETLISPPFMLTVPADSAAGSYRIYIGLYNYVSGERLPVEGDTAYLLTTIQVSD